MCHMSYINVQNRVIGPRKLASHTTVGIRTRDPDLHKRLKIASAEEGLPIGELVAALLDLREDRIKRARAQQGHPLRKVALE